MRPAENHDASPSRRRLALATLSVLAGLFVFVLLRTAWLCDDAYISYRTVANAVDGYGLVYNPGERVQTYTHPLWLLIHIPAYATTGEIYYTGIALAMLVTTLAMALLCGWIARRPFAIALTLVTATSSSAFMDFSTSGLENPLTHLLLAVHAGLLLRPNADRGKDRRRLLALALTAGLAASTRMDSLLLHLPGLCAAWWPQRGGRSLAIVGLGLSPFLAWLIFATFYYGSPLPNTAFAKLDTGTGLSVLLVSGLRYLGNSLLSDPVTLLVASCGVVLPVARGPRRLVPLSVGICLYLLYVLRIGGDFMSGRLLTAPFFMGLVTLAAVRWPRSWRVRAPVLVTPAVLALLTGPAPLMDAQGVADERRVYFRETGLIHSRPGEANPSHPNAAEGRRLRDGRQRLSVQTTLGFYGYFAGPRVHLIDPFALADPLLSRLPAVYDPEPRVGHFQRAIPAGYFESRVRGTNQIEDPEIRALYANIRIVTQDRLWSRERLAAILGLDTGSASKRVDRAARRIPVGRALALADVPAIVAPGSSWNAPGTLPMRPGSGVRIQLGGSDHAKIFDRVELSLAPRGVYVVVLQRGDEIVFGTKIFDIGQGSELQRHEISLGRPFEASDADSVAIYPLGGVGAEGNFSLGHLRLL